MSKLSVTAVATAFAVALALPAVATADSCDRLPRSALKAHACNPQAECLRTISRDLPGPERVRRESDCGRLPTAGHCHGPDRYDPQADCRKARRR